jgi:hypothetical protein
MYCSVHKFHFVIFQFKCGVFVSFSTMDRQEKTDIPFSHFFCMSPKNEVALSLITIICSCFETSFVIVINDGVR